MAKLKRVPDSMDLSWGAALYHVDAMSSRPSLTKKQKARLAFCRTLVDGFQEMKESFEKGQLEQALEAAFLCGVFLGKSGGSSARSAGAARGKQQAAERDGVLSKVEAHRRRYQSSEELQRQYTEAVYIASKIGRGVETARRHLRRLKLAAK